MGYGVGSFYGYRPTCIRPRPFGYTENIDTNIQRVGTGPSWFRSAGCALFGGAIGGGLGAITGGLIGRLFPTRTKAATLNLDGQAGFNKRRDGVLTFDFDGDGKISRKEIRESALAVQGLKTGRYNKYTRRLIAMDTNGDGRFSTGELARGGAKVWVDKDGDGRRDSNELRSVYDVRGNGTGQRLQLDGYGQASIRHQPWRPPFFMGGGFRPNPWGQRLPIQPFIYGRG